MARAISKLAVGRVYYCCWCTDDGKIIADGTVMRRGDTEYFVTSADPSFSWFTRFAHLFQVSVEDVSEQIAALALQGPESRDILNKVCDLDCRKGIPQSSNSRRRAAEPSFSYSTYDSFLIGPPLDRRTIALSTDRLFRDAMNAGL